MLKEKSNDEVTLITLFTAIKDLSNKFSIYVTQSEEQATDIEQIKQQNIINQENLKSQEEKIISLEEIVRNQTIEMVPIKTELHLMKTDADMLDKLITSNISFILTTSSSLRLGVANAFGSNLGSFAGSGFF